MMPLRVTSERKKNDRRERETHIYSAARRHLIIINSESIITDGEDVKWNHPAAPTRCNYPCQRGATRSDLFWPESRPQQHDPRMESKSLSHKQKTFIYTILLVTPPTCQGRCGTSRLPSRLPINSETEQAIKRAHWSPCGGQRPSHSEPLMDTQARWMDFVMQSRTLGEKLELEIFTIHAKHCTLRNWALLSKLVESRCLEWIFWFIDRIYEAFSARLWHPLCTLNKCKL